MENKANILIIEDDVPLNDMTKRLLTQHGYYVTSAYSGSEALLLIEKGTFDLILLDLMLPGIPGETVLEKMKSTMDIPIIGVSAKTDIDSKVNLIRNGADDYITKPFSTGELLARVRAALRLNRYSAMHGGNAPAGEFRAQGMRINYDRRKVFVDEQEIKLTQTEYNIVAFLSQHAGRVMTYAAIVKAIWGDTDIGSTKKLQVNMANIRKKLGSRPGSNAYILNELGVGYRMIDEDARSGEINE